MIEKKPYSPPQLFRVELSQEQTILSACSLTASNPMAGEAWTFSAGQDLARKQAVPV